MRMVAKHSCNPKVLFVLYEHDGMFYEIWSRSRSVYSLYVDNCSVYRECHECSERYQTTTIDARHIVAAEALNTRELFTNPLSFIMRKML